MKEFQKLIDIVKRLRDPKKGCPWDLKQTSQSLVPNLIEEVYEVVEAIELDDSENLKEELGDFLFHIIMQTQIADEKDLFKLEDSIKLINEKLIRRHPHIFSEKQNLSPEEIVKNWEEIKMKEKTERKSILDGIPKKMPSLIVAQRMQEKAASQGFDWDSLTPVYEKITEEVEEFKEALENKDKNEMEKELGDILFSVVNLARKAELDAETSLRSSIKKFEKRYKKIEDFYDKKGKKINESSLEELDEVWEIIKKS